MNSNRLAILFTIFLLAATAAAKTSSSVLDEIESSASSSTSQMVVDGNAVFTGQVTGNKLVGDSFDVLEGTSVTGNVVTDVLFFDSATISSLTVSKVVAKGSVLNIQGDLIVRPAESSGSQGASFLEKGAWYMHSIETFEKDDEADDQAEKTESQGWDVDIFNECDNEMLFKNRFLGGHCALSYQEVSKQYDNLPAHKNIKVQAKFHLFDDWKGEGIYIKTDGHIVWSKNITSHNEDHSINLCGGESSDPHYNLHAEFTLPHEAKDLKLTFGSTLDRDPCEVSYAIDDVVLLIK
mmetsp:Transcript_31493/g.36363  ORF Transcript_31493/g.36363 Transcript_31493/m.36363 type:complete len:294 (-) Transcript_31493:1093-1974(-)